MDKNIDIMNAIIEKKSEEIKRNGSPELDDEIRDVADEKRMTIDRPIKVDPLR